MVENIIKTFSIMAFLRHIRIKASRAPNETKHSQCGKHKNLLIFYDK